MDKKLTKNIEDIKRLIYEQETKEGIVSDIKDFLVDKFQGAISDTPLEKLIDKISGNFTTDTDDELKKIYSVPTTSSTEMSTKEKREFFSNVKDDNDFYAKVLWGLNLPVTSHNINFLKLWRIAEMGTEKNNPKKTATNNPFNSIQPIVYDPEQSNFNNVGVKNYSRPEFGIEATIKTLKNGFYNCILDGLRNQRPYEQIADCKTGKSDRTAMDVWGTTSKHMKNIIKTYRGSILEPKKIDFNPYDDVY